jgi:hypothetical protein
MDLDCSVGHVKLPQNFSRIRNCFTDLVSGEFGEISTMVFMRRKRKAEKKKKEEEKKKGEWACSAVN